MIYIADIADSSLLVYSFKEDKSWRVNNDKFSPQKEYATMYVNDTSFFIMNGPIGLSISPKCKFILSNYIWNKK